MSEERKKFEIKLDEPAKFNAVGAYELTTIKKFGEMVSQVFRSAFVDFEGVYPEIIKVNGKDEFTFSLVFNHGKYDDDDRVGVKLSTYSVDEKDYNPVNRLIQREVLYKNGIKYLATEDLKDVVEKLLFPYYYNKGKINWGNIVNDFVEPGTTKQCTKVTGISPNRLASLVFGRKDDKEDDIYDYDFQLRATGSQPTQYIVQILRASTNAVNELYANFGITNSNIIR